MLPLIINLSFKAFPRGRTSPKVRNGDVIVPGHPTVQNNDFMLSHIKSTVRQILRGNNKKPQT